MRRTSPLVGLDFSTGRSISLLPVMASVAKVTDFHELSRAPPDAQVELAHVCSCLRVREAILASLGSWAFYRWICSRLPRVSYLGLMPGPLLYQLIYLYGRYIAEDRLHIPSYGLGP
jgi:hypothetical protein